MVPIPVIQLINSIGLSRRYAVVLGRIPIYFTKWGSKTHHQIFDLIFDPVANQQLSWWPASCVHWQKTSQIRAPKICLTILQTAAIKMGPFSHLVKITIFTLSDFRVCQKIEFEFFSSIFWTLSIWYYYLCFICRWSYLVSDEHFDRRTEIWYITFSELSTFRYPSLFTKHA